MKLYYFLKLPPRSHRWGQCQMRRVYRTVAWEGGMSPAKAHRVATTQAMGQRCILGRGTKIHTTPKIYPGMDTVQPDFHFATAANQKSYLRSVEGGCTSYLAKL